MKLANAIFFTSLLVSLSATAQDSAEALAVKATPGLLGVDYIYDASSKRDPFQPDEGDAVSVPVQERPVVSQEPNVPTPPPLPSREHEPLESFELERLKITGIMWNIKKPRAMITDPKGGVHFVGVKSRLGKRNGFVVAIREGEVVVVEYNPELDKWVKSFKVLELR